MPKMKTIEEYKQEVKIAGNDEYEVLSDEYKGNKTHLKMLHKICGFEYMAKPNVFLSGSRCPFCAGKVRKNTEYFKKEVFDLVGDEYKIIGEYKNTHTKIKIQHNCGNVFEMSAHNFLGGQRCPKCQHRSYKKTTDEFKQEVYDLVGDEYIVDSEYINNKIKIKFIHSVCNNEYWATPTDFLSGYRCCYCYGNMRKTQEQFEDEIFEIFGDEYKVLGEYKNFITKVLVRHNSCGNEWYARPSDMLFHKSGCPACNKSKGELQVEKFLKLNNINFVLQKRFSDCKYKNTLPFDFYLPDYNTAIEYDGHLHYMSVDFFGGDEKYEYRKKLDKIKTEYCTKNNIKLIRIPYWEYDNIARILDKELEVG